MATAMIPASFNNPISFQFPQSQRDAVIMASMHFVIPNPEGMSLL